jgi:uncharacterized protein with ATP-grasp and redox domains
MNNHTLINGVHIQPECIPCFFRQALQTARLAAPNDDRAQLEILRRLARLIAYLPPEIMPPKVGRLIHDVAREVAGKCDIYGEVKVRSLKRALQLLPELRRFAAAADNPLKAAVAVAIAGNVIDMGANPNFNLEREMKLLLEREIEFSDFDRFADDIAMTDTVLYIGDNLEEAVFDKVLIEALIARQVNVVFAVREAPVFNDLTIGDALELGMDEICEVVSSGSTLPGTDLRTALPIFREMFDTAPVVISKGQGNFESLAGAARPIYFLFKVKCVVVERVVGLPVGSSALLYNGM